MNIRKILICCLFGFIYVGAGFAQNRQLRTYSFPPIQRFSDEDYNSYIQNWDVTQDSSGLIYIANIGEVLEYDGVRWQAIQFKKRRSLSIEKGINGKIYVGGVGSIGYLDKPTADTSISLKYHSLIPAIPNSEPDISNVWDIF